MNVLGAIRAVAHRHRHAALDHARRVQRLIDHSIDDHHVPVEARARAHRQDRALRVHRALANLNGRPLNRDRRVRERVRRVLRQIHVHGAARIRDDLRERRLDERARRGHDLDRHLRAHRATRAIVHAQRQRASGPRPRTGLRAHRQAGLRLITHRDPRGDVRHAVGEGRRVGRIRVGDHQRQVHGRLFARRDADHRRRDRRRVVLRGLHLDRQGQRRRGRRIVPFAPVEDLDVHEGLTHVARIDGERNGGLVGRQVRQAGAPAHGRHVANVGVRVALDHHEIVEGQGLGLPRLQADRHARGVHRGHLAFRAGHRHDRRGGQPILVRDRVDHEAAIRLRCHRHLVRRVIHAHAVGARGDRQLRQGAIRILVVGEHADLDRGAVARHVGQRHEVVARDRRHERRVRGDVHRQLTSRGTAAAVLDHVGDDERILLGGRRQRHGGGRHDRGLHLAVRGLQGSLAQLQGVAVGVDVVRQDVDLDGARRARLDDVGQRNRVVVEFRGRGHAHAHARLRLAAQAVLDRVGEDVSAGSVRVRRVLDPLGAQRRRAHRRGLIDAHQGHGVAVRVDAGEGHRDARRLAGGRPRRQSLGLGRGIRLLGADDVEGRRRAGRVAGAVGHRVGHVDAARLLPGLETHQVTGHEGVSVLGVDRARQGRGHAHLQAGGRTVVREDLDGGDVAHAHLRRVVLQLERGAIVLRARRNDGHRGRGRARPVGHRVGEARDVVEAGGRGHAQEVAVDEGHLDARVRVDLDGLDDEDAAGGIRVVGQGRDQGGAAAGQDRDIVLGDGSRVLVAGDDVHAHDADDGLGPVADGVGELVGAHLRAREGHDAQLQVGHQRRRRGRGRDLRERQDVAVGVRIVRQGRDHQGFAHARDVEVGVRDRRDVAGLLDEDGQLTLRGQPAVGHVHGHRVGARGGADIADRQGTVLGELNRQALGALGPLQEDLVAVRVDPVGQDVVFNLRARAELDVGVVDALGADVLAPRVHPQGDVRGGRGQAVGGGIGEGTRPLRVVADARDLQGAPAARDDDGAEGRLRGRLRGEHVTVGIGVVLQNGQERGFSGAHAEIVVDGRGGRVLLVALRVADLLEQVGVGFVRLDLVGVRVVLIPVVDHDHVAVGQPHGARIDVVEDDAGAVDAEDRLLRRGQVLDVRITLGAALAHADRRTRGAPRAVCAALVEGRGRGDATDARPLLRRRHGGGAAVQRHAHERIGGRQEHRGRGRTRHLQGRARGDPVPVERARAPRGQHECIGRRVVNDGLVADRGDRQVVTRGNAAERGLRHRPGRARARHRRQRRVLRRVGVDSALHRHRHDAPGQAVGDGLRVVVLQGVGTVRVPHPQVSGRRVEDRERRCTLRDLRALRHGDRTAQLHARHVDGRHGVSRLIADRHRAPILAQGDPRARRRHEAVEGQRIVVQVAQRQV